MTTMIKNKVRTIWISDTHLGSKGCQAEALAAFLKHYQCEKLYLVGDIIDGWRMRKKAYWPQTHTNVIRRILTLAKRGTEVHYITGNHDEFLRRYSDSTFGHISLTNHAVHDTADGRKLMVVHGDEFDVVVRYHRWLAVLGDHGYNFLLNVNYWFNRLSTRLGYDYWSLSAFVKQRVKKAVQYIGDFEEALAKTCDQKGYDGVICGHIHHAEIRAINNIQYMNCGDWVESCTALVEDQTGQIRLVHWLEERQQCELISANDDNISSLPVTPSLNKQTGLR